MTSFSFGPFYRFLVDKKDLNKLLLNKFGWPNKGFDDSMPLADIIRWAAWNCSGELKREPKIFDRLLYKMKKIVSILQILK